MKFLRQFFSKTEAPQVLTKHLSGSGTFDVEVTGLSLKYLDVFWKANSNEWNRAADNQDLYERRTEATIASDSENRVPHAISVEIGGKVVGHLPHPDALRLHRAMKALGYEQVHSKCAAIVVGRIGYWAVNLDLDLTLSGKKPAQAEQQV